MWIRPSCNSSYLRFAGGRYLRTTVGKLFLALCFLPHGSTGAKSTIGIPSVVVRAARYRKREMEGQGMREAGGQAACSNAASCRANQGGYWISVFVKVDHPS